MEYPKAQDEAMSLKGRFSERLVGAAPGADSDGRGQARRLARTVALSARRNQHHSRYDATRGDKAILVKPLSTFT